MAAKKMTLEQSFENLDNIIGQLQGTGRVAVDINIRFAGKVWFILYG